MANEREPNRQSEEAIRDRNDEEVVGRAVDEDDEFVDVEDDAEMDEEPDAEDLE